MGDGMTRGDDPKDDDSPRRFLKSEENMFEWISFIRGPDGSVYENGIFEFELSFPIEYPFKPPNCKFKTRIYHCNINSQGNVCLDILQVEFLHYFIVPRTFLANSTILN